MDVSVPKELTRQTRVCDSSRLGSELNSSPKQVMGIELELISKKY